VVQTNPNIRYKCEAGDMTTTMFHSGVNLHTLTILDALAITGKRAAFFIIGSMIAGATEKGYLKRIEAEGHVIAYSGMSATVLTSGDNCSLCQKVYEDHFLALDKLVAGTLQYGLHPYYYPFQGDIDIPLINFLATKGITTIIPNYNNEVPLEGTTSAQHIAGLYSLTSNTVRASTDNFMNKLINRDLTQHNSYISLLSGSMPKANDYYQQFWLPSMENRGLKVVDFKECMQYDRAALPDKRAPNCYSAACAQNNPMNQPVCRSQYNTCDVGPEFCNADSTWIPDCAKDISLGLTPIPTATPTAPPTTTTAPPTVAETAAPTTPDPGLCLAAPCFNKSYCRNASGTCGGGSAFCNIYSTWVPGCPEQDSDSLPSPTYELYCKGEPCGTATQCRSPLTLECGAGPEYCNVKAVWTQECKSTSGAGDPGAWAPAGALLAVVGAMRAQLH